ncbi:MAG: DUF4395 domain-containing protein [Pseudomonadota bacterium]|nr:DUF4395 domain-containing protein [Pseudomonadota bacterium]
MLRFDLPQVPANVIRWEAFITHLLLWLAMLVSPWFLAVTTAQGLVKGFAGHQRCPSHVLWRRVFEPRGWGGKLEDVGAKMFAAKLLMLASAVGLGLFLAGSTLWQVPVGVLLVFSFLEWALGFCAGCWAYGAWYRAFPPKAG